jgi:hypothetical protein
MKRLLLTIMLLTLTGCTSLDLGRIADGVIEDVKEQREANRPPKDLQERLARMPQRWLGEDYSKLPVTVNLRGVSYHGIHLTYDFDIPSDWTTGYPSTRVPGQKQHGICVHARIKDGVLVAGMYDYLRHGSKRKGMQPLETGFNGLTVPAIGEEDYHLVVDLEKTGRSNWKPATWQGRR